MRINNVLLKFSDAYTRSLTVYDCVRFVPLLDLIKIKNGNRLGCRGLVQCRPAIIKGKCSFVSRIDSLKLQPLPQLELHRESVG